MPLALSNSGQAYYWGLNNYGQAGDGIFTESSISSPVVIFNNSSIKKIDANGLILYNNGSIVSWGINSYGQIGNNSVDPFDGRNFFVETIGNHSFIDISSAGGHVLALKANGELWSWGYNEYGQLGINTSGYNSGKSSPVLVVGNHSFIKIAFINTFQSQGSAALKANGEVWSWGLNIYGQLGNNTRVNASSPVLVVGNHSFVDILAGAYFSHALKANGEVWSWGYNYYGQLGDNTSGIGTSKSSPVLVVGGHSFSKVYSFNYFISAIGDNNLYVWGRNLRTGAIFVNNINYYKKSSPDLVSGNYKFIKICGDADVTIGLSKGKIYGWGDNTAYLLSSNIKNEFIASPTIIGTYNFQKINYNNKTIFGLYNNEIYSLYTQGGVEQDIGRVSTYSFNDKIMLQPTEGWQSVINTYDLLNILSAFGGMYKAINDLDVSLISLFNDKLAADLSNIK